MLKWSKRNSIFDKYYKAIINKKSWYEIICNMGQMHVNYRFNASGDMADNQELKRIGSYFYKPSEIKRMKEIAEEHYKRLRK